ncbi:MAG: hypothetical protein K5765_09430 [Clostridia bacterium]|nr:hypothetical protein [Clostridia bacterium]
MGWFNYYGLGIVVLIMIPNIIYSIKKKDEFIKSNSRLLNILEQVGRYGSISFMIFNIPYTYFGFFFGSGLLVYLITNGVLILSYEIIWAICWNKYKKFKTYILSIIPSIIFVFSGIILLNIPLILVSIIFAISHITISINSINK